MASPPLLRFFYALPDYGVPISTQYLLDIYEGLNKGLVHTVDELFVFLRLNLVKKVEHMDAFERAFAFFFFDVDIPAVSEGDPALFDTHQFQKWLQTAIEKKEIPRQFWQLSRDELMRKFWETLRAQMERHDGGNKWVGTGGSSPFGHSGAFGQPGVRVHGPGQHQAAIKAIGARHYIAYASNNSLTGSNMRQALDALKSLKPSGAYTALALDETLRKTAQNGGEIELVFQREQRDKIAVMLLIDNGGRSMLPHVDLTRLLFAKMQDRFQSLHTYYFHNTIYGKVYRDPFHREAHATEKLLQANPETRLIIVGDASMAPEELMYARGSLYFEDEEETPSIEWLHHLQRRFRHRVWLNPIPESYWHPPYGAWTLHHIRGLFPMEDLSLAGIKKAVERLNR